MFLLDTMVISEMRKTQPHPKITEWLEQHSSCRFYLSVITLGEIRKGICPQEKFAPEFAMHLMNWLQQVENSFGSRVLPVTNEIAKLWGIISWKTGNAGIDNIIAATAEAHHLTIVTRNIKHFQLTGVPCVNPWAL